MNLKRMKVWAGMGLVILSLSSCGQQKASSDVKLIDKASHEVEVPQNLDVTYDAFFEGLPKTTPDEATDAFYSLEKLAIQAQLDLVETVVLDESIQTSLADCFNLNAGGFDMERYDGESCEVIQDVCSHGFTFVPFNGVIYPVVNYEAFEAATPYVSREVASYIALKSDELSDYMTGDNLTQEDLIQRLMLIETHLAQYPTGETSPAIYELYKTYFYDFVPLSIRRVGTVSQDDPLLEMYGYFINAHQGTVTATILSHYIETLEANDYVVDEMVLKVLEDFNTQLELYFTKVNT